MCSGVVTVQPDSVCVCMCLSCVHMYVSTLQILKGQCVRITITYCEKWNIMYCTWLCLLGFIDAFIVTIVFKISHLYVFDGESLFMGAVLSQKGQIAIYCTHEWT